MTLQPTPPSLSACLTHRRSDTEWRVEDWRRWVQDGQEFTAEEHVSTLLPPGPHVPLPEDWPLSRQMQHLRHLQWWISIFPHEINVIFWCIQASLVFLSERIKGRGDETLAVRGFLLTAGRKG